MRSDFSLGRLAEMQFCVDAAKRGLNVSIPQHDHNGYDLIVEGKSKKLYKIQVKSTRQLERSGYKVTISRGNNNKKRYDKKEVDFFAVYIVQTANWFIIPFAMCNSVTLRIYPSKPDHKYTSYIEGFWQFK